MNKNRVERRVEQRVARREEGQSLIIIGALLVVLVALIGLVVDAGNAYAQRRIVQNAVDAASMAGALELARQDNWKADPYDSDLYLYNYQVIDAVEDFVERNGVNPDDIGIYYADIDGNILADAKFDLAREDIIDEYAFGGPRAEAIIVEATHDFPTYLVRVIGRNEMSASANASALVVCGVCTAGGGEGLFPIAVYTGLFDGTDGVPDPQVQYHLWAKDPSFPGTGSFGYLSWNHDGGHTSETTLAANMADTTRSGGWSVGDMIPTGPGVKNSNAVERELKYRINDRDDLGRPKEVTLPIYDYTEGTGANLEYHVTGFGRFEIECYHFSKNHHGNAPDCEKKGNCCTFDKSDNGKWIAGRFVGFTQPYGAGGCTDYGICTVVPAQLEIKRALAGRVVPWRTFVQQGATLGEPQPVDVVHVVDISGSMCDEWDGTDRSSPCTTGGRIEVAKQVLTGFNTGLTTFEEGETVLDHQIGLATYPTKQSAPSTYDTDCGLALGSQCQPGPEADCYSRHNKFYFASKDRNLTADAAAVNAAINNLTADGGTSMPLGLQYGREMVTDPLHHDPDHLQVLILTSDGMPNIKIGGEWTGYSGNYTRPPLIVESGCNDSVYQAAIEQANLAKEQGVVVFTIGIHEQIDEDLMRAIASPDTHPDKPHFFQAQTGEEFEEIYQSIEDRLPKLGVEECVANENAAVGAGAWVYLYDDQGNQVASTQASSTGDFVFDDVEPGTYELRASWIDNSMSPGILYDVMTWTLGGDPADEPITVDVPLGKQTTQMNLYLRTDQQFTCP